jgi:hypothetical protein
VHVCVDDCTRLACVEVLASERTADVVGFLRRAVAFFNAHGIQVQRLMTDNGPAYRSIAHAALCRQLENSCAPGTDIARLCCTIRGTSTPRSTLRRQRASTAGAGRHPPPRG